MWQEVSEWASGVEGEELPPYDVGRLSTRTTLRTRYKASFFRALCNLSLTLSALYFIPPLDMDQHLYRARACYPMGRGYFCQLWDREEIWHEQRHCGVCAVCYRTGKLPLCLAVKV